MILDNTPVLVGVGQCVQRDPGTRDALPSPMDLLERAARAALADTGAGPALAAALDSIASRRCPRLPRPPSTAARPRWKARC